MTYITVIKSLKPSTLGKRYELDADGSIAKSVVANVQDGEAIAFAGATPERLAVLLKHVCEKSDIALMSGRFLNATSKEPVNLVTERRLAEVMGCKLQAVPGGVQLVDGEKCAARVKRGIEPGCWILIDADNPAGIPEELAAMTLQERLEFLEPIVPGIRTCTRVEYRASSARVVKDGQKPGGATHAWIQISDAAKLGVLREHVRIQMQLQDRSFPSPRYSRETGQIIGSEAKTVIDLAVWLPGRLVFCSKPEVLMDGYHVVEAGVKIVNSDGGALDVSSIALPSQGDLDALRAKTGHVLSYSRKGSISVQDKGTLSLDTVVEVKGVEKSLDEWVGGMNIGDKLRCETPFRASSSEAAFIRVTDDGMPVLYDVGTNTAYHLSEGDKVKALNQAVSRARALFSPSAQHEHEVPAAGLNKYPAPSKPSVTDLLDDPARITRIGKRPAANHASCMEIMRFAAEWDGVLAYNELTDQVILTQPVPGSHTPKTTFSPRPVTDDDHVRATAWFNRHGFPSIGKGIVADAIETAAKDSVISPVRHYLEGLEQRSIYDPQIDPSRLDTMLQTYFGVEAQTGVPGADPGYLAAVAKKFMIAAVARALDAGCKVDTMLVLEGAQGAGKSTAIRLLASPDWFSDNLPPMGTKEASDHVRGKWLIEVAELSAFNKADVESLKAFVSRQHEKFRPPYGRKEITYPRRCVFIGTTNQDAYLRDETGNRRFWPVKVGKIDLVALKRDRDLLWAEALYYYRNGEPWYLTASENRLAESAQRDRISVDAWQSILSVELEGYDEVAIMEAAKLLQVPAERLGRADQNRITAALRGLGFVRKGQFSAGRYRNSARYVRDA